jgi:tetratricopeptide (TPR) repeat protein
MHVSAERVQHVLVTVFAVLVLANAFAAGLRTVSDSDTGWHVATGRYVWQHHTIPSSDILSYTSAGMSWIYPPFGGVLLYLAYRAGGYTALSWVSALACVGVIAYLVRKRTMPSLVLAMLAIPAIAYRTAPRADLFTTLLFAVLLGELWSYHCGQRARLWVVPVIMLLWVNLHPGFIAGLAVLGAYVVFEAGDLIHADQRQAALQRLRETWPWMLAGVLATLVNPWGVKIYPAALNLAGLYGPAAGSLNSANYIQEFAGVPVTWQTFLQLFDVRHLENGNSWLLLIAVLLVPLAVWRKQPGAAVVVVAATYAALAHARYLGMFAIVIVTLGATLFEGVITTDGTIESGVTQRPQVRLPWAVLATCTAALCAIPCVHIADYVSNRSYVYFRADSRFGAGESFWFPERAARFVEQEKLPGNVFETFAVGGFAALQLGPGYPNFIDGRADHLNPALFLAEQKLVASAPDSAAWRAAANQWNINTVIIANAGYRALQGMDANAFCSSTTWRPVYLDEVSVVLVRNSAANQPWLDRLAIDCATAPLPPASSESKVGLHDHYLNVAGMLYVLRRDSEAEDALYQAAAYDPADPNTHFLLARLYQREQRLDAAEQEYRHGLAMKDDDGAWFELSRILAARGQLAEAKQALQKAIRLSLQPLVLYMTMARLELKSNQPREALEALQSAEKRSPFRHGGESVAPELYAEIAEGRAAAYAEMGSTPQAIEQQQLAVKLTPAVATRWIRLANLLQTAGEYEAAAAAKEKAQELSAPAPGNP